MNIFRYVAFSQDPGGGNPAGVVLDALGMGDEQMQNLAAEVGYSETAFVTRQGAADVDIRYFSPLAEVPFCGHATIATAVALAQRDGVGTLTFNTQAGPVPVTTVTAQDNSVVATLVSVRPRTSALAGADLTELLSIFKWSTNELDPALPPRTAYAGAWHPVLAALSRSRLAALDYDMAALTTLMRRRNWATVSLIHRESETKYHARNPFPPGGVVEDPATGAAAAAFGGYLRELGLIPVPLTVTIYQGFDMGRPSTITVSIPADPDAGIAVTGTAVRI